MTMTTEKTKKRLTAKQEAFCVNYVLLRNGTKAAIAAGYSPKTAETIAAENLGKPIIQERRAELEARIEAAKFLPEEERRQILAAIAREQHFQRVTASDRIRAVDTLNKLDKLYADNTTNINFNEIKILVVYEDRKKVDDAESRLQIQS